MNLDPVGQPGPIGVIRLGPGDADRYVPLRRRMLADAPWAFAASPEDDRGLDPDHLRLILGQSENAILAIEGPTEERPGTRAPASGPTDLPLVGAIGVYRAPQAKFRHRAKIWGFFVEPPQRGRGLGRALVTAAIELARGWPGVDYADLGVSENAPEALRLYESLGFRVWGREPESLQHEGRRYDELFLTLQLTP